MAMGTAIGIMLRGSKQVKKKKNEATVLYSILD